MLLGAATPAAACNIPVFRYALERWPADPWPLVVFHRGSAQLDACGGAGALRAASIDGRKQCNLVVQEADLDAPDLSPAHAAIWNKHAPPDARLPWAVLRSPHDDELPPVWAGTLADKAGPADADGGAARRIVASPVRAELARRLLGGESVVWLVLESGNKAEDDRVAEFVTSEVAELAKVITLPPGIGQPGSVLRSKVPLEVRFSVMRLRRDDPEEGVLRGALLAGVPGSVDGRGPLVFPIFGRGRSLDPLAGEAISAEELTATAAFLCAKCGCEVKRLNPGFDLLMSAEWDAILGVPSDTGAVDLPLIGGGAALAGGKPVASDPGRSEGTAGEAGPDDPLGRNLWWMLVGGVSALVVGSVVIISRR